MAIELARRGYDLVGVDLDPAMLEGARAKAPELRFLHADLDGLDLGSSLGPNGRGFAAVVAAGNVMIFLAPGSEARVVASLGRHLEPGGLLIAGFQLTSGGLDAAPLRRVRRGGRPDPDGPVVDLGPGPLRRRRRLRRFRPPRGVATTRSVDGESGRRLP